MARLLVALPLVLSAVVAAEAAPSKPLFASDEVFSVTLTGPLRTIGRDRNADPAYQPAQLTFNDADGVPLTLQIGLRARGKSRRNPDACNFPPLRLDLPKKDAAGTVFDGQNKLKLVTQCQTRDPGGRYEQNLLKELGLYRVFNALTPISFRVRLVEVTYVDTDRNAAATTSLGFFIEDKADLAKRNHLKLADVKQLSRRQLHPEQTNRVEMFQYLIGNTDFSVLRGPADENCCHNVVPLLGTDELYRPVPYDFDATGVVDPPYAMPVAALHIKNVRQRRYRGRCNPPDVFEQIVEQFRRAQPDIYAALLEQPRLQQRTIKTASRYLDQFYTIVDDPNRLQREILRECQR